MTDLQKLRCAKTNPNVNTNIFTASWGCVLEVGGCILLVYEKFCFLIFCKFFYRFFFPFVLFYDIMHVVISI